MPTVATESAEDTFDFATDWQEFLATADPSGPDVMSSDGMEATLVGQVPANKVRSALAFFLGYSYATGDPTFALRRLLPARHPIWPFLHVKSCQFHRHNPIANPDNANSLPYVDAIDESNIDRTGSYIKSWVTLHFSPRPFDLLEDEDVTYEYERFCNIYESADPSLDTLSIAGGQKYMVFTEGDPAGKEFPGEVVEYKSSTQLTLAWDQVPADYIFDDTGFAKKLIQGVGCVNDSDFLGWPAGTLLCYPPKFRKYAQPVRTTDGSKLFAVDVKIVLGAFDPEPAVGYGNSALRGWQLLPWFEGGRDAGGTGTGDGGIGWYSAYRPDGTPMLKPYSFLKFFDHVLSP